MLEWNGDMQATLGVEVCIIGDICKVVIDIFRISKQMTGPIFPVHAMFRTNGLPHFGNICISHFVLTMPEIIGNHKINSSS